MLILLDKYTFTNNEDPLHHTVGIKKILILPARVTLSAQGVFADQHQQLKKLSLLKK